MVLFFEAAALRGCACCFENAAPQFVIPDNRFAISGMTKEGFLPFPVTVMVRDQRKQF